MKDFKGTKGEWTIVPDFRNPKILNADGQVIFEHNRNCWDIGYDAPTGQEVHYYYSHNKMMANAKLISAAPDLLEALNELYEMVAIEKEVPLPITTHEKCQLAIEKALG